MLLAPPKGSEVLRLVVLVALAGLVVLVLLLPIEDNDFWWHLKSGEVLAGLGHFPGYDPFSFTGAPPTERARFILRSYWLSQLLLHASFAVGGFAGVIVLRAATLLSIFASLHQRMRKFGVAPVLAAATLSVSAVSFALLGLGERPQTFSLLGATLLLGLMERASEGRSPSWLVVPLMVVWANLHGGFIVGVALLAIFALGNIVQQRSDLRRARPILAWCAAGILASLANPCLWQAFAETTKLGNDRFLLLFVDEYATTWELFRGGTRVVAIAWAMCAVAALGVIAARERRWPDVLLLGFASWFGTAFARNVTFLTVAFAPLCAHYLHVGLCRLERPRWTRVVAAAVVAGALFLIASSVSALRDRGSPLKRIVGSDYPEQAAAFLKPASGCARIFNEYDWGGYLIWTLAPERRIFIDGRLTEPELVRDYSVMIWAMDRDRLGPDGYRDVLDRRGIDCVIQRDYLALGDLSPLAIALAGDPSWAPVYVDPKAFVFARRTPSNAALVGAHAMTGPAFGARLLDALALNARQRPGDHRPHVARFDLLVAMGRSQEAEQELMEAARLAPSSEPVRQRIAGLRPINR